MYIAPAPLTPVKAVFRPPEPAGPRASAVGGEGTSRNAHGSRLGNRAVFARSKLFVTSDASGANGASASRARSSSVVSNTDATGATSIDKDRRPRALALYLPPCRLWSKIDSKRILIRHVGLMHRLSRRLMEIFKLCLM